MLFEVNSMWHELEAWFGFCFEFSMNMSASLLNLSVGMALVGECKCIYI